MSHATLNGVSIAYDDIPPPGPAQRTILLLHGFASNRNEGWKRTGWYSAFERRGIRTIALDQRGHGESVKSHDPGDYGREKMAADALALLDHLGVGRCDVFGYSMGTRTAMQVALDAPERVTNLMQDLAQREDPLQAVVDNAGEHVLESLDPKTWVMPLEIFAEASRNPVIAEMLHCADVRSRKLFLSIIRDARIKRGLPADEEMLEGRLNTMIAMYQGLPVRAVHNPDMKVEPLIAGFRIVLTALLLGE